MAMSRLDSAVDPQYLYYRLYAHEYADNRALVGLRSKTSLVLSGSTCRGQAPTLSSSRDEDSRIIVAP
jgi:hypothetical protein